MPETSSWSNGSISAPDSRSRLTSRLTPASSCSVRRSTSGLCGNARRKRTASWKRISDAESRNLGSLIAASSFAAFAGLSGPRECFADSNSVKCLARILRILHLVAGCNPPILLGEPGTPHEGGRAWLVILSLTDLDTAKGLLDTMQALIQRLLGHQAEKWVGSSVSCRSREYPRGGVTRKCTLAGPGQPKLAG